jgi:four helix bundle suffix protein
MIDSSGSDQAPAFIAPHGGYEKPQCYKTYSSFVENATLEVAANTMVCMVHQTNYLLDQFLHELKQTFLQDGRFTERLYKARQQARTLPPRPAFKRNWTNRTDPPTQSGRG